MVSAAQGRVIGAAYRPELNLLLLMLMRITIIQWPVMQGATHARPRLPPHARQDPELRPGSLLSGFRRGLAADRVMADCQRSGLG